MADYTNPIIDAETLNDLGSYIYGLDVEERKRAIEQFNSLDVLIPWPLSTLISKLLEVVESREIPEDVEECGRCGRELGSLVDTNCPECEDDFEEALARSQEAELNEVEPDMSGNWMKEILDGHSL